MRPQKPARLYLRKSGLWVILDQGREIATGLRDEELAKAALAKYLSGNLRQIIQAHMERPRKTEFAQYMGKALLGWWGDKHPQDVNAAACRAYAAYRNKKPATIRHELQFLRSALSGRGYVLRGFDDFWMPPSPEPKSDYFLTRSEVAKRLRIARKTNRHVCRALLIGVYTGTRPGATLALRWKPAPGCGWFDLEAGIIHRGPETSQKKRKGKARIHFRLMAHLRRWKKDGNPCCVHYHGDPVKNIKTAWNSVARAAGQGPDGPHICRHTCATWLLQSGVSYHEAAGFLSMSVETLEKTYGHHSPNFQQAAARARGR